MGISTLDNERTPLRARSSRDDQEAEATTTKGEGDRESPGARKKKITISLSEKSMRALNELRRATDADTDSEVFRNALRLHLMLLRAHSAGVKLFMRRDGSEESVPVTLFNEAE
jgi:hypothetical protein